MVRINKTGCTMHSLPVILMRCLLAMALCCFLTACSSGNNTETDNTGAAGNRVNDIDTSVNQASTVVSAETPETAETKATTDLAGTTAATGAADAAAATAGDTGTDASAATNDVDAQGTTGNSGSSSSPDNGSEPKATNNIKGKTETGSPDSPKTATVEVPTTEAAVKTNDKLIGKDSGYSFYLGSNKSVYAVDSAGNRTDCTMLSEYSGWTAYFEFNSDIYIYNDSTEARKACSIPSGDMFLGESDFHIYYISADFSTAYSINESGARHDSAIILYGGNYYFALDSSIYTVMPNGQGLRKLYSEHAVEVGPHYEHILGLVRIENGIIYYTDESTGDVFNCQYDMSKGKAFHIDPSTGKIDPW